MARKANRTPLDGAFLRRWDAALAALAELRQAALEQSMHDRRTSIALRAWKVAAPLYAVLEARPPDDAVATLLEGLDRALMSVIDDPFAGRGLSAEREDLRGARERLRRDGGEGCCLTLVQLRNLLAVPARVTASGALGASATRVFKPGERRPLRRKEFPREGEADGEEGGSAGGGITIPGGLGHCVTLKVEIQNQLGEWVEIMSRQVCCDTDHRGDILRSTFPPPPPGATTRPRDIPVLELVDLESLTPCPERDASVAPDGSWGKEYLLSPGLDVPGKGHFVGAHVFLLYVPPQNCRQFCFIQAVKRTVTLDGRKIVDRDWRLDLLAGQPARPGCYAYQRDRPEGGRVMNDSPGLVNPWGAIRLEDGSVIRPRPGQRLVANWEFRSWAVCLRPRQVYGEFTWSLRVEVTVPAQAPPQGGRIPGTDVELTPPRFTPWGQAPNADKALFDQLTQ